MLGRLGAVFSRLGLVTIGHGTPGGGSLPSGGPLQSDFSNVSAESWFFY
jgi:hypothetical protein